ncbi:uncharacterized protein LOC128964535 [Oppia nitens]|uniref:uncharacterized protein LOC128964535 n=1 Tax=Oppia nitens TaxID=1686743 RepID=UPI0023DCA0F4|nr:uncharacterized protein LOC128964535 [Oppia nitens]
MALQIYIIANSIKRFTIYLSLPWPNGQPPFSSLNAYVVFIGTGVVMLPFFVVLAMMKVGNYPNDGHKLGNQSKTYDTSVNNIYQNLNTMNTSAKEIRRKKRFHSLRVIWRHCLPMAPFMHLLASLCFLIPRVLMEAQLIKHGFLGRGDIWKTEMDFVLNRLEDKRIPALSFLNTITDSERSQLNLESFTVNTYLTKQSSNNFGKQYEVRIEESGVLSVELINFAVALFIIAVRYPSVFWRIHKGFGFLFSVQIVINLVQSLLMYSAFQVAFKVLVCDPSLVLVRFKPSSSVTPLKLCFVFISYIILLTISGFPLYMYGLFKYREWRSSQNRRLHVTLKHNRLPMCGYLAHFYAFIALIVLAICVSPLLYQFVVIYCGSLDSSLLISIISTAIHLFSWVILWLILTIKSKWHFNITFDCIDYQNRFNYNYKSIPQQRGETPLLVIENGKTYQIREMASKQAILGMAHKSYMAHKTVSPTEEEDIYWLRPKLSTPNKTLSKESPEDDNSITWIKSDKKSNINRSNSKKSFDENAGNGTNGSRGKRKLNKKSPKSTLKSKKNKNSEIAIELEDHMSDNSDGEYATLRKIINNQIESTDLTHLNLCPLKNEMINMPNMPIQMTTNPAHLEGEYEILVEKTYSTSQQACNTNLHLMNQINNEITVYPNGLNSVSGPLTVAPHIGRDDHNTDQLTPRSGSISETSTSPEKASDTSSGVHSNSSNENNGTPPPSIFLEKRSSSMESLMQQIQAAEAANKPCFRSLSLQRYMASLPTDQTYNNIPHQRMSSFNENDQTIVIRRAKRPQRTSNIFTNNVGNNSNGQQLYGRETNLRMTSFTENNDYMKFHSMPAQPKMVAIPSVPTSQTPFSNNEYSRQTFNDFKPYIANQNLYSHVITGTQKPVVSIAPQVMSTNGNSNFLQQSQQQREPTNYSFISSHTNPIESVLPMPST